jgi:hypothetical protein
MIEINIYAKVDPIRKTFYAELDELKGTCDIASIVSEITETTKAEIIKQFFSIGFKKTLGLTIPEIKIKFQGIQSKFNDYINQFPV